MEAWKYIFVGESLSNFALDSLRPCKTQYTLRYTLVILYAYYNRTIHYAYSNVTIYALYNVAI